jgi:pimeloyl-ACP methyl ester carboxylesterase
METVTSRDGTPIAYDLAGYGPPVIFASGVFNDHTTCAPVAELLERDHTVVTYDRRGRGHSGDTTPYAVEREIEDLAALVDLVGGAAAVFGYSSGGVLALKAAADGVNITRLALYEPPFVVGDPARERPPERPEALADLVEAGRPGDAVAMFQTEHLGMPAELVAHFRESPMWPALEAFAPSMVYDAIITTAYAVPSAAMTAVATPTLVLNGAATWPGLRAAAVDLAARMPAARHHELAGGENHTIPPAATATAVREFLR